MKKMINKVVGDCMTMGIITALFLTSVALLYVIF